jgi:hypothetical protein
MIRQKEQLQSVIVSSERKLVEANKRLAWVQQQEDRRIAAEFLVEQIRMSQEDRMQLMNDN